MMKERLSITGIKVTDGLFWGKNRMESQPEKVRH